MTQDYNPLYDLALIATQFVIVIVIFLVVRRFGGRSPARTKRCPNHECGASVPLSAEVCIDCGRNVNTGERVAQQRFVDVPTGWKRSVRYTVKNGKLEVRSVARGLRTGRAKAISLDRFTSIDVEERETLGEFMLRTLQVWGVVICTGCLALPIFFFIFPTLLLPRRPNQIVLRATHNGQTSDVEFVAFRDTDSMNRVVGLIVRLMDLSADHVA